MVWGEMSQQYLVCRDVAERVLRDWGGGEGEGGGEIVGRMEGLGLSGGVGVGEGEGEEGV